VDFALTQSSKVTAVWLAAGIERERFDRAIDHAPRSPTDSADVSITCWMIPAAGELAHVFGSLVGLVRQHSITRFDRVSGTSLLTIPAWRFDRPTRNGLAVFT